MRTCPVHLLIFDGLTDRRMDETLSAQLQLNNTEGEFYFIIIIIIILFVFFFKRHFNTNRGPPALEPLVPAIIYPQWNMDIRGWNTTTTTTAIHRLLQAAKTYGYKLHRALYL